MNEKTLKEFENLGIKIEEDNWLRNMFVIEIEGDMNDADYITKTTTVDKKNFIEENYIAALKYVKNNKENIKTGDCYDGPGWNQWTGKKEIDKILAEILPFGPEGQGIREVTDIKIRFYDENGKVYRVEIN